MSAYYRATLAEFLQDEPSRILGILASRSAQQGFTDHKQEQTRAWEREIAALRDTTFQIIRALPNSARWSMLLEYPIPRRQKRIDLIILAEDLIFCIEFKTDGRVHARTSRAQVEDYALDLRDFHEQSHGRRIIPIAVTLLAGSAGNDQEPWTSDPVQAPRISNAEELCGIILKAFSANTEGASVINAVAWDSSAYRPFPTIIEAAEALYAEHDVREIAHSHAGATNLSVTSDRLIEIIREAQSQRTKVLCFVTGVPGAGKTLAGLNVVHNPRLREQDSAPGIFLSGNGPLVKVVRAAIERDFKRRKQQRGAERKSGTFIQNVHEFVRHALATPGEVPAENILVFDEAQRAWDCKQNAKKSGREESEPQTILGIMDRHSDWAVIIALVGGGQEINVGEAGLAEWGRSVKGYFPHWRVAVSPSALSGDTCVAGHRLFEDGDKGNLSIHEESALHLNVNLRAYRVQRLTEWVNAVLIGNSALAREIASTLTDFPLAMTRDLSEAKSWLRERTRGFRRSGLVASSGALRLRADGLELSSGFRRGDQNLYINWFLNLPPDVRSSNQLEVAASEYDCQGLELDFVGLCWGGDLYYDATSGAWKFEKFIGTKWQVVRSTVDHEYILNKYRVLLTRAREGAIVWVPRGDSRDSTRDPKRFDETAEFLIRCGLSEALPGG